AAATLAALRVEHRLELAGVRVARGDLVGLHAHEQLESVLLDLDRLGLVDLRELDAAPPLAVRAPLLFGPPPRALVGEALLFGRPRPRRLVVRELATTLLIELQQLVQRKHRRRLPLGHDAKDDRRRD